MPDASNAIRKGAEALRRLKLVGGLEPMASAAVIEASGLLDEVEGLGRLLDKARYDEDYLRERITELEAEVERLLKAQSAMKVRLSRWHDDDE